MGSLILLAFVVDYEGGKERESEAKPIVGAFGVVGTSGCVESRGSPCDLRAVECRRLPFLITADRRKFSRHRSSTVGSTPLKALRVFGRLLTGSRHLARVHRTKVLLGNPLSVWVKVGASNYSPSLSEGSPKIPMNSVSTMNLLSLSKLPLRKGPVSMASASYIHTSTPHYYARPMPPKDHYFQPIADESFPQGYVATGLYSGIKKHKDTSKPPPNDLGVVISTSPRTSSAACFTLNAFKAAPVVVSGEVLAITQGRARALVVNSGCANAVTGKQGMQDAWDMVRTTDCLVATHGDGAAGSVENQTLVMSTGVIGQLLPTEKILQGIGKASSSLAGGFKAWEALARAFMTTDTFPKLRARSFDLNGTTVRFAGIDKGAGMIHPKMGPPGPPHATLLGLIATDAAVSPKSLQSALTWAVDRSFNSISIDGDMSTNDTIVAFANGASGMETEIDEETNPEGYKIFRDEMTSFAVDLAKLVVRDGEGATKFVTVSVEVRIVCNSGCSKDD